MSPSRRQDKERQDQYHHELEEMQHRLESRPLLLEQPSLVTEARYKAALKKAGLSDEQIQAVSEGTAAKT